MRDFLVTTLLPLFLSALLGAIVSAGALFLLDTIRRRRAQKRIDEIRARPVRNPNYGKRPSVVLETKADVADPSVTSDVTVIEQLTIRNFKSISELRLDLTRESSLAGNWTCIAGINGAGKTSILQALCLVLLGSELVIELGRPRLGRMRRRTANGIEDAEIEAVVRQGGMSRRLYLPLTASGVDEDTLRRQQDFESMRHAWSALQRQVLVGYGASRNVSDYIDPRLRDVSRLVQRQMTLFDPLTQLSSVDVLLKGGADAAPVIETLHNLLRVIVSGEAFAALVPERPRDGNALRFSHRGASVDVIDLPDGFRSTVAWLADVCAAWHEREGASKNDTDPSAITGIVLLDELSLHLHPSLERALVPQLRKALPNVQFVTTTHSPMVLSSFDRDELVILDDRSPTGTRALDRQVLGFTMDDIYAWLMDTPPGSGVMEEILRQNSSDPDVAVYLYQSKDVSENRAREIIAERERQIASLRRQAGKS